MDVMLQRIFKELIFWLAWIVIPILWEVTPAVVGFFILILKKFIKKKAKPPIKFPEITIIIPVYNSENTLFSCLDSIFNSDYPQNMMTIIIVDNGSRDNSYNIFIEFQQKYTDISLWWMSSKQGKSKALNLALFNSKGKYIINVDSDGKIEKNALKNMIFKFEQDTNIDSMTGTVLIDPVLVDATENFFLRLTRRCEMYEYFQAFLAGRNYESVSNTIYTLSGAFSAFRKSSILKSMMYNSITVSEDTHITFQLRCILNIDIHLCEDALFFVDPIEDYNKLYTQRQRWQRGEIEVSHMFLTKRLKAIKGFFTDFMVRILMYDHTFAFPRAIWYFAIIYLFFKNYPFKLIIGSFIFLYMLYVLVAFLFYACISLYLKKFKELRKQYMSHWYICFILPLFSSVIFWIRFASIINSIKTDIKWKTLTFTEEIKQFTDQIKTDFRKVKALKKKIERMFNNE